MKKFLFFIALVLLPFQAFGQENVTIYMCDTPDFEDIGYVSISYLKKDDVYLLAIEWLRPVGREDVQEVVVAPMSDFTVDGYDSEDLDIGLRFYAADDIDGKRDVLELDGKEINVDCQWVGK